MRLTLVLPLLAALAALAAPRPVRLFDGKSLAGWEGNTRVFRVEKGAITAGSLTAPVERNEFLCTRKAYDDFDLRLKFRLVGQGANAGIQIRSRRIPNHHEMVGYQADLGEGYWGALYDESRRNRVLASPNAALIARVLRRDGWNDYRIRCQGRRVQLWLNGRQTVDYTEPDEGIEQAGLIGLQIHGGPPSQVWYKDITLVPLTATRTAAPAKRGS